MKIVWEHLLSWRLFKQLQRMIKLILLAVSGLVSHLRSCLIFGWFNQVCHWDEAFREVMFLFNFLERLRWWKGYAVTHSDLILSPGVMERLLKQCSSPHRSSSVHSYFHLIQNFFCQHRWVCGQLLSLTRACEAWLVCFSFQRACPWQELCVRQYHRIVLKPILWPSLGKNKSAVNRSVLILLDKALSGTVPNTGL